ncbi:MAG: hypothetical protein RMK72_17270, partial [Chloroflexus sp.]
MEWFSGDVSNSGRVDYTLWSGGPQLPPLNPEAIASPDEEPTPVSTPGAEPEPEVPVVVIEVPT